MKITRRLVGAVLAGAMAAGMALPAVAQSSATQALSSESVIETIKKRGVIKIGLSLFVPWSCGTRRANSSASSSTWEGNSRGYGR